MKYKSLFLFATLISTFVLAQTKIPFSEPPADTSLKFEEPNLNKAFEESELRRPILDKLEAPLAPPSQVSEGKLPCPDCSRGVGK